MRKRCRTCKWWDVEGGDRRKAEWGDCKLTVSDNGRPVHETKAYAADAESYYAELVTHRDFGCTQWEARGEDA